MKIYKYEDLKDQIVGYWLETRGLACLTCYDALPPLENPEQSEGDILLLDADVLHNYDKNYICDFCGFGITEQVSAPGGQGFVWSEPEREVWGSPCHGCEQPGRSRHYSCPSRAREATIDPCEEGGARVLLGVSV